ncbi:MAG: hypothetical protein JW840_05455 [Candidatus Thermoplasmatota archaeon]|nr:hypothetical protein [Candidatus Thermoplasmatota archaeon]
MKNNIIYLGKAALVLAITLAFVLPVSATTKTTGIMKTNTQTKYDSNFGEALPATAALFEDDFESYDDFVLSFPPWTQLDGDGEPTWGFEEIEFLNEYYTGAYIIFNPTMTDPELTEDSAHSGEKYAACFDAVSTEILNDDWLITPQLTSGDFDFYVSIHCVNHDSFWLGIDDFAISEVEPGMINISFWAKTGSSEYEPDRFQVGVSVAGNDPADFKIITESPYVEPPVNWTEYIYTVSLGETQKPELSISVKGGLGVTATITNTGAADATNCDVTFAVSGGLILSPSGGSTIVNAGDITADGGTGTAKTMIIGFGKPSITVTVLCDEGVTASITYTPKFLLFFFLLG